LAKEEIAPDSRNFRLTSREEPLPMVAVLERRRITINHKIDIES